MKRLLGSAVIVGAMLLAGCNMVVSDEPVLSSAPDGPAMKAGLWVDDSKEDCRFDPAQRPEQWPECADPAIVTEDGRFYTYDRDERSWRGIELVLAPGEPTVVQVQIPGELTDLEPNSPKFVYLALNPTEFDAAGRMIAIEIWIIFCGPVDPSRAGSGYPAGVTTAAPFAGLTMDEGFCRPRDLAALRNAARRSVGLQDEKGAARWVGEAEGIELD